MSDANQHGYIQRLVGDVRILVLGARMLTDAEFDAHVVEATAMAKSVRVVLLAIMSAPPMSAERRAKLERAGLVRAPTAVLTDSIAIRAVLTALCWLGGNVRPFAMDGELRACEFLAVPAESRQAVVAELRAMIAEITGMPPRGQATVRGLAASVERINYLVSARADKIHRRTSK